MRETAEGELPPELDFFKYARGGAIKRKVVEEDDHMEGKKRKMSHDSDSSDEDPGDESENESSKPSKTQHRVVAKGANVPEPVDSFEELGKRYELSGRLLQNVSENGFTTPTGIQSHGTPILMEVGT